MKKLIVQILDLFGLKRLVKHLYQRLNFTTKSKVNNKEFLIPHIYGSNFTLSEEWMLTILKALFKLKKGTFLDIGVNLGQTLVAVKSIENDRRYIGFEPNPACIFYVEELKRVNNLFKCDVFPVGLYTSDDILSLDLYDENITNSGGSIVEKYWEFNHYKVKRKLLVPVFSFNSIAHKLENPQFDIIKIDVEGAELEVLQTLKDVIVKDTPLIIIEILSAYSIENKLRFDRQNSIELLLNDLNYKILRIVESDDSSLKKLEKITGFDVNANPNDCNYILYHEKDLFIIKDVFKNFIVF